MRSKTIPPVSLQVSQSRYCHLEKVMLQSRQGLHVACAGHEVCRADYVVKRSAFPCYGLEYVESGSGTVFFDSHILSTSRRRPFCLWPNHDTSNCHRAQDPVRKYFVDFFGREASHLLGAGSVATGTALQISDPEAYRVLLKCC